MMATATNYYQAVVSAAEEFLGPAAERFIRRQIEFHLEKDPATINRADVLKLRDSIGVALSLLVEDRQVVHRAIQRFDDIATTH